MDRAARELDGEMARLRKATAGVREAVSGGGHHKDDALSMALLARRIVPNDNDCLFATFSYLCEGGKSSSPQSARICFASHLASS